MNVLLLLFLYWVPMAGFWHWGGCRGGLCEKKLGAVPMLDTVSSHQFQLTACRTQLHPPVTDLRRKMSVRRKVCKKQPCKHQSQEGDQGGGGAHAPEKIFPCSMWKRP